MGVISSKSFIDYSNVEPFEGPLENVDQFVERIKVHFEPKPTSQPATYEARKFNLVETQVQLEDSLIQLFTEPKELTLLNIDIESMKASEFSPPEDKQNLLLEYVFDLS